MVTYPSTHGVFEAAISEICEDRAPAGGRFTWTGRIMNAQSACASPGDRGGRLPPELAQDVLHPAWRRRARGRPIGVARTSPPFLPGHRGCGEERRRRSVPRP